MRAAWRAYSGSSTASPTLTLHLLVRRILRAVCPGRLLRPCALPKQVVRVNHRLQVVRVGVSRRPAGAYQGQAQALRDCVSFVKADGLRIRVRWAASAKLPKPSPRTSRGRPFGAAPMKGRHEPGRPAFCRKRPGPTGRVQPPSTGGRFAAKSRPQTSLSAGWLRTIQQRGTL